MIDILIIGSGGAGLTAALEAKKSSKNVVVLSKTYPTQSQTCQAQGGINAVLSKESSQDTQTNHINDTLKSAHHIGNLETIHYMCNKSEQTIKWLDDIGVPFSRDDTNTIAQRKLGGASQSRACYSSDYTGLKILHTLYDNCIKEGIEFINEHMLLSLITENNVLKGIITLDIKNSEVKQILAKSVILATGGYAGLYDGYTTNSTASTGETINSALEVGVKLSNMEYIQFHPTSLKQSCILISESARGEGGYLVTADGKRFVDELSARDIVARAIDVKIQNNEEVFLDLRHLGIDKIKEVMPQEYDLAFQFAQLKLDKDLIPITPAAHYTMGGIKTNLYGETNIKNLYAVGECSSNGVHGANRLGGNSLLEIVTFGKLVAQKAIENSKKTKTIENKEYPHYIKQKEYIKSLFTLPNHIDFYPIQKELGELLYNKVGLFREEIGLKDALKKIEQWEKELLQMGITDKSKIYNTNLKEFIEFTNKLQLSKSIVISAIHRKESRGAHYRVDFKSENKEYAKETILIKKDINILVEL